MQKPKMIIFDFGQTLFNEQCYDGERGFSALFRYVTKNKHNLTPADVNVFSEKLYHEYGKARSVGMEIHQRQFQKMLFEYLGIELSISFEETEMIIWDNALIGSAMPDTVSMIDSINKSGIRSAVISNIIFSENVLRNRFDKILPNNRFEFIIATSEYGFRKPSSYIYNLALNKAGLSPSDVWYCGDSIKNDVMGSSDAGIFPVWFDDLTNEEYQHGKNTDNKPVCEHLHIHNWLELVDILNNFSE